MTRGWLNVRFLFIHLEMFECMNNPRNVIEFDCGKSSFLDSTGFYMTTHICFRITHRATVHPL